MVNQHSTSNLTPLQHLQDSFAIVDFSGSMRMVNRGQIKNILGGKTKGDVSYYAKPDANIKMHRHLESLPLACTPRKVIEDFWNSPSTHLYDQIAFDPRPTPNTTLNFWAGHLPDAKPGNWVAIRDYMLKVICSNDQHLFDYLISYLAHMVQHPEDKPGVMLALLGGQGTGKGVFFTLLRAIWPMTTLQVSKIDQVVGRFTSALERNYIICMDEALFAGDRQAIDNLKSIVTEQYLHIEQKFQPSRTIESVHRLFAASNHEHFAHIESDDRRFVFLRVSNVHQQDTRYFSSIARSIADDDTIKALIYYLQRKNLATFNVRNKPHTNEQFLQKIKSLQGFERFWYEVLSRRTFNVMDDSAKPWSTTIFIATTDLLQKYLAYNKGAEKYHPLQESQVLATINRVCPKAKTGIRGHTHTHRGKVQLRGVRLPSLDAARQDFCDYIGHEVEWEDTKNYDSQDTDQTPP